MAAGALDELSGGRFCLGISSGAGDFLNWIGITPERPVAAVTETVRALRKLFRGERVAGTEEGRFVRGWTPEAYLRFPTREIPIYIGAMSPAMLRTIGRIADGGLPLLFPPEHFATAMSFIQEGLNKAERSVNDVDVAACIWCSVSQDRDAAEAVLRDKIAYYGHALSPLILQQLGVDRAEFDALEAAQVTPAMLRIGVVGTAQDLIPRLENLISLGARHLSFGPPLGPDPVAAIEILGKEVLPRFR